MSRISCFPCVSRQAFHITVHLNATAAARAALWLFVETPSLFYPNMSCHHNNRIVDFCPCLKHTTNRFYTHVRTHTYISYVCGHDHRRHRCCHHRHSHHHRRRRSSYRCFYHQQHTFRHEKPHHQSPAQI